MTPPLPLLVVEASQRAFLRAIAEIERAGARVVSGWQPAEGVVCAGVVRDASDAAEALLAGVAGAGLAIHAVAARHVVDRLVDDLRRLGPVEHRTGEPEQGPTLTEEERRLLGALAQGGTLSRAAEESHLSRRTADRRLRSAKEKLGAASTAEAVVAYLALGKSPS